MTELSVLAHRLLAAGTTVVIVAMSTSEAGDPRLLISGRSEAQWRGRVIFFPHGGIAGRCCCSEYVARRWSARCLIVLEVRLVSSDCFS